MKTFCPMVLFPSLPGHQKGAGCWVFCVVMVSVHGLLVVAPEIVQPSPTAARGPGRVPGVQRELREGWDELSLPGIAAH